MAKTRLTNADRLAIRDTIIAHKFSPIEAGLKAEEHALAIQGRAKACGDFLPNVEAAPDGTFPTSSIAYVNLNGRHLRLNFGSYVRMFDKHCHGAKMLSLTDSDPFAKKVMAWAERSEAVKKERAALKASVDGTLAAFRTFDDLQAGWPEADRFICDRWRTRPNYVANVPAIAIAELTAALDLPPEVAEAA